MLRLGGVGAPRLVNLWYFVVKVLGDGMPGAETLQVLIKVYLKPMLSSNPPSGHAHVVSQFYLA